MRPFLPPAIFTAVLWSSKAVAQTSLATGSTVDVPWLRIILSFLLCILLAVGAIFALRVYHARGGGGLSAFLSRNARMQDRRIEVVEMRRINPHIDICIVRFGSEELLLSLSRDGTTILARDTISKNDGDGTLDVDAKGSVR